MVLVPYAVFLYKKTTRKDGLCAFCTCHDYVSWGRLVSEHADTIR